MEKEIFFSGKLLKCSNHRIAILNFLRYSFSIVFLIVTINPIFSQNKNKPKDETLKEPISESKAKIEKEESDPDVQEPEPPADPWKNYDEGSGIVVTGSRGERRLKDSTVATEIISRKKIESTGARNAAEVLETQLGVNVSPFFGGSQIQMLGLDSKYVLFLVDGQRIAGRLNNTVDLTRYKVQNIERIEIVKGSSSALYGADAIGGVINIITREAEKPEHYEFRTTYGMGRKKNFGNQGELNTTADVGFKNEIVAANVLAGFNQAPGYDIQPENVSTTANSYRDNNVATNLTFNPDGNLRLKTGVFYLDRFQEGIEENTTGAVFDRKNDTKDFMAIGGLEYLYGSRNMVSFRGNYSVWENRFERDQRKSDELDAKELNKEISSQGTVQWDHEIHADHFMTLGVESFAEELESDRLENRFVYRTRHAGFLQDEWTILRGYPRVRLVPGVRFDQDSQFGGQATPKLAIRVDILDNLILRTSYGRGFRPPSFRELFLRFENPGVGYAVEGNPDLKAEKSSTVNADIEWSPSKSLTFFLSLFRNDISNLIQYDFGANPNSEFALFQLVNIDKAYTRGGELGARFKFLTYFALELGYNHTDTRDLASDRPLEGRPLHQATMNIIVKSNSPDAFEFSLRGKHIDRRPFYSSTNQFTGGSSTALIDQELDPFASQQVVYGRSFNLLSMRIAKNFFNDRASLFLGVENIFDRYEITYNPIRPRFFYGGFSAKF
ncbi:TonB-dependent receptor plug domain-containing protein [Leptospira sp. GIMC2001]|uniref:TonB-dependent receptor plug domain-containing protein n=1 Tax=Leptospira sp. GIMC2001 TaxID=1513297 RepID=UPI00234AAB3A|nr:TonB-dependent receptor [Leptospira sp. GIMC2001]WCL49545.1 TonB-dependent receptor [Leptospira sp. GIMC2001]